MEIFDIVDESGCPTGEKIEREEAHRLGIRHRTAHVWLTRMRGEPQILLQKRSMDKDSFPGCLDTSSAGHIPAGCDPISSALRELHEELGITASPEDLRFAGQFRADYEKVFHGRPFHDNEVVNIYILTKEIDDRDIRVQPEELDGVEWQDFSEVEAAKERHDPRYCVPMESLQIIRPFLFPGEAE